MLRITVVDIHFLSHGVIKTISVKNNMSLPCARVSVRVQRVYEYAMRPTTSGEIKSLPRINVKQTNKHVRLK